MLGAGDDCFPVWSLPASHDHLKCGFAEAMDAVAYRAVAPVDCVEQPWCLVSVGAKAYSEPTALEVGDQLVQVLVQERVSVLSGDVQLLDACFATSFEEWVEVTPLAEWCLELVVRGEKLRNVLTQAEVATNVAFAQEVDVGKGGRLSVALLRCVDEDVGHCCFFL